MISVFNSSCFCFPSWFVVRFVIGIVIVTSIFSVIVFKELNYGLLLLSCFFFRIYFGRLRSQTRTQIFLNGLLNLWLLLIEYFLGGLFSWNFSIIISSLRFYIFKIKWKFISLIGLLLIGCLSSILFLLPPVLNIRESWATKMDKLMYLVQIHHFCWPNFTLYLVLEWVHLGIIVG